MKNPKHPPLTPISICWDYSEKSTNNQRLQKTKNCTTKKVNYISNSLGNLLNSASVSYDDIFKDVSDNTLLAAASGTGFFINKSGILVSNNHVIDSCDKNFD